MSPRTAAPALPADLEAGLKRLKLSTIRAQAPEILLTAKTQRWAPEETVAGPRRAGDRSHATRRTPATG